MSEPTRPWLSCFTGGSWSRCTPASDRAGGSPTLRTCPSTRPATPCGISTGSWPPPVNTAPRWGPTPSDCWTTRSPGPGCARIYRLLALARRYGQGPVNTACARALQLDVVSVTKIASMLEQASENTPAPLPPPVAPGAARFARDPAEFTPHRPTLTLLNGGKGAR
jgi:hypothetical protein